MLLPASGLGLGLRRMKRPASLASLNASHGSPFTSPTSSHPDLPMLHAAVVVQRAWRKRRAVVAAASKKGEAPLKETKVPPASGRQLVRSRLAVTTPAPLTLAFP